MHITPAALFAIIPHKNLQKKLNVGAALLLTRRHFCSQMTSSDLCTKKCTNCAAAILSALENIERASKPAAMYVARLRHEFANIAERQEKPEIEAKKDGLGLPVEREDIFEDLLAGIS